MSNLVFGINLWLPCVAIAPPVFLIGWQETPGIRRLLGRIAIGSVLGKPYPGKSKEISALMK
ncbi:MAG TPA: hypothetical protein V6D07_05815 [Trichocoleus sp.]